MGVGLGGIGKTLVTRTTDLFDQVAFIGPPLVFIQTVTAAWHSIIMWQILWTDIVLVENIVLESY